MPVTSLRLVSHRLVGHRQQNAKKSWGRDMTLPSTWRNLNTSTQSAQQAESPLLEAWLSKMADVWKTVVNNARATCAIRIRDDRNCVGLR